MLAGTLWAWVYFIAVGWTAHSGCTYMLAGMLGVHMIISGPRCYFLLKDIISAKIGWDTICGHLIHMKICLKWKILTEACGTTVEQSKKWNIFKRKRVGTLRSQVHWLRGLLTRWHGWCMVVWLSHDGHVISAGIHIPKAMGVHFNYGSGCNFRCDRKSPWDLVECDWNWSA